MQGETVSIEFVSADATTAAAVTLKDKNNATRTLLANEQLYVDTASCTLAAAVTSADLLSDNDADGTTDANELIATFGPNCGNFVAGEEGFACHKGITPKVKAAVAGVVRLTGNGRICLALGSQLSRPAWKEAENL